MSYDKHFPLEIVVLDGDDRNGKRTINFFESFSTPD